MMHAARVDKSQKNIRSLYYLASGIPNLQIHLFLVDDDRLELEVHPKCLDLILQRHQTTHTHGRRRDIKNDCYRGSKLSRVLRDKIKLGEFT